MRLCLGLTKYHVTKHRAMKTYGGGGIAPCSLNRGARWRWVSGSRSDSLNPGKRGRGTNWIGGWVEPRAKSILKCNKMSKKLLFAAECHTNLFFFFFLKTTFATQKNTESPQTFNFQSDSVQTKVNITLNVTQPVVRRLLRRVLIGRKTSTSYPVATLRLSHGLPYVSFHLCRPVRLIWYTINYNEILFIYFLINFPWNCSLQYPSSDVNSAYSNL